MKKFTKVLALLAVGFSIVGFSSCAPSDSGNKDPISQKVPVSKISFELEKTELDLNEKTNIINVSVTPNNATNQKVYFSVSDQTVLSINDHTVTAIGYGSAYVTAFSVDNPDATYKVKVDVVALHVKEINLSLNKQTIEVDEIANATVSIIPETALNKNYVLYANPTGVVRIENNKITGIHTGTVVIKAKSLENGIESNSVNLQVTEATPKGVILTCNKTNLLLGETSTLNYTVTPSYAINKEVEFKTESGTSNVISISNTGVVKAEGIGEDYAIVSVISKPEVWNRVKFTVSEVPISKINLYATKTAIEVEEQITLTSEILPLDATYKSVGYKTKSGNTNVLSVTQEGVVTGKGVGKDSVICYSVRNPSVFGEIAIEVVEKPIIIVDVTGLNLTAPKTNINIFDEVQLSVEILPSDATTKDVTFATKSGNNNVIEVSNSGLVKAVGEGKDTIICKSVANPSISDEIEFTVTEVLPTGINVNKDSVPMLSSSTYQINASVAPSNATYKDISYKVLDRNEYVDKGERFESSQDYSYTLAKPAVLNDVITVDVWFDECVGDQKFSIMFGQGWGHYFGYYDVFTNGTLGGNYAGVSVTEPVEGMYRFKFDLSLLNKIPAEGAPYDYVDLVYIRGQWSTASGYIKVNPTIKPDILSVNSTGLVTAFSVGEQKVRVYNSKYPTIYKDVTITVSSNPIDPIGEDIYIV